MQIIDNKALLLKVKDPNRITQVIPKSKVVSQFRQGAQVAVHWGLEECTVLKNLGVKDVPSPILRDYNWPGLHRPFAHQKTTSAFLTMHRRAFCFSEAGTAKTSSVIWAADYLMNLGLIKRVLVVCPLSIMNSAWVGDLFKTAMHRSVIVAHSKKGSTRKEILTKSDAEFTIINYDGIEIVLDELKAKKYDLVVVDEANYLKTSTSKRFKTFLKLLRPDIWLWMLTGTPAAQSPTDAYGLARLVNPDGVPRFFGAFRDMVMYKVTNFKWVPKPDAQTTVFNVLQPAIRYTKAECLDLPDLTYVTRDVPLSPQQEKYYQLLKKQALIRVDGEEITAVNAAAGMNKLLQLVSGCTYTDSGEVVDFDVKDRMDALKEVIDEASHKVLIFVPYTHAIQSINAELTKSGYDVAVIDGSVSLGKRTDIFNKFQNTGRYKALIIQPQAASHGVTLHAANIIVYWTPVMSVETYLQCNARIDRAGQRNPTTVIHLQGSPLEKKIYTMLQNKIDMHHKLVELYKEILE